MGRLVAERLARDGFFVLIHGRDIKRGHEVASRICSNGGSANFLDADLSDLRQVQRLAHAVRQTTSRLSLLINNAGTTSPSRLTSADGYELCFAVNYLAGFLLSRLLLPELKKNAPSRIVNVVSAGQEAIDFEDVMLTLKYEGQRAYRQSKLAQILSTVDLAEETRGTGVTANAVHPATYMNTNMVRRAGIRPMSSVAQGADAILNLAISSNLAERSGGYFNGLREAKLPPQAQDQNARQKLRFLSLRLTAKSFTDGGHR